ncbi:bifunctional dTDP-4-dehydrorhamnose 3,5-epimerase family protein/NAD(P)-dependent oxidoreductase [Nocardioides carbamazepini]|uniref:bifunctional dTDP-4-dehydrorhamnose 3,5-epimerase family protein/NAD(P)-dependent oxidoreductase n=1 Tax=Nocardioides carbamazepini TaxID=2854259 RepID=UPI00214A851B|nr:bifunctional dTDP-4-dehydrorhamnose 3,5-epimerase family protein/NAD(P)-dependent oxidoreductase [Nocardioides carbamazepini]MCR1783546.1 bifunctional dTDP-4-dehydrorhamnose 3,5-epimerase family protein/NAD(P)-dependent oxidoreductase [Nocardioides carbamazepini]
MSDLRIETTSIPGLLVVHLPVHGDDRGWFKENWQREKMVALGLPDFGPVQNNMSFNASRGATRGIHTEPWDKFVSVAVGKVFAAWVDMREGESFGATYWTEVDESVAVFVPRGVGNSYQALADGTVYSYLVNDHYVAGRTYPALDLADPTAGIPWPLPLDSPEVEISAKDRANPALSDVTPMAPKKTLITGCRGQLGRALAALYPDATLVDLDELDLTDAAALAAWPWEEYGLVLNAAAYTAVDKAETPEGRPVAWAANAMAPAALARIAAAHGITVVHYSTDYVFDGSPVEGGRREDAAFAPLGVYGQTKAAGDLALAGAPRHYILRTSWVIGDGHNFVRTMARLAADGVDPAVVSDQVGRLTFTAELARASAHLVATEAPYGTYNVTNGGTPRSWADYARRVFELTGHDPARVGTVTTEEYAAGKSLSPRPLHSTLALDKLAATGFVSTDADEALAAYLRG